MGRGKISYEYSVDDIRYNSSRLVITAQQTSKIISKKLNSII
jgi:hypothetical protein